MYRVGLPHAGTYQEVFNTDAEMFGGSNIGNGGAVTAIADACHGRPASARVMLPPLGVVVLKPVR
jgi:1,4-alpha-glucan branching enzyme